MKYDAAYRHDIVTGLAKSILGLRPWRPGTATASTSTK